MSVSSQDAIFQKRPGGRGLSSQNGRVETYEYIKLRAEITKCLILQPLETSAICWYRLSGAKRLSIII